MSSINYRHATKRDCYLNLIKTYDRSSCYKNVDSTGIWLMYVTDIPGKIVSKLAKQTKVARKYHNRRSQVNPRHPEKETLQHKHKAR